MFARLSPGGTKKQHTSAAEQGNHRPTDPRARDTSLIIRPGPLSTLTPYSHQLQRYRGNNMMVSSRREWWYYMSRSQIELHHSELADTSSVATHAWIVKASCWAKVMVDPTLTQPPGLDWWARAPDRGTTWQGHFHFGSFISVFGVFWLLSNSSFASLLPPWTVRKPIKIILTAG